MHSRMVFGLTGFLSFGVGDESTIMESVLPTYLIEEILQHLGFSKSCTSLEVWGSGCKIFSTVCVPAPNPGTSSSLLVFCNQFCCPSSQGHGQFPQASSSGRNQGTFKIRALLALNA